MMDHLSSFVAEEDVVASLPQCVRRLRGPGRARRQPAGSAYRSAGAVLRRVLLYSEDGQAHVQIVRSDGIGTSPVKASGRAPSAVPAPPISAANTAASPSSFAPSTATSGMGGLGLMGEAREAGIDTRRPTHLGRQEVSEVHAKGHRRRERAATLAAETERRYEEQQESALAGVLQALPLLRVVPPLSLQQQVYTRDAPPPPPPPLLSALPAATAAATVNISDPSKPFGGATQLGSAAAYNGGAGATAALRATQARYGAGAPNAHSVSGSSILPLSAARDWLGLSSAVLLTDEEPNESTPAVRREETSQAEATALSSPLLPTPSSALAVALLPPTIAASPSTPSAQGGGTSPALANDPADATGAMLSGAFIDGGLGATIRIGASCDEPNSLRYVAWGGCRPVLLRAVAWRLLSDYAPVQVSRQQSELQRKRRQYEGYTRQYCSALTMLAVSDPAAGAEGVNSTRQSGAAGDAAGPHSGHGTAAAAGVSHRNSTSLSRLPAAPKPNGLQGQRSVFHNPTIGGGYPNTEHNGVHINGINSSSNISHNTSSSASSLAPHEKAILHQMLLDLPRHQSPVFHARRSVAGMARCLFLWAQRHPAVGYVQGMDDVVAIFYQVFLADALRQHAREQLARTHHRLHISASSSFGLLPCSATRPAAADAPSNSGEDGSAEEWEGSGSSDTITRDIMRLLLVSLRPPQPTAASTSGEGEFPPAAGGTAAGGTVHVSIDATEQAAGDVSDMSVAVPPSVATTVPDRVATLCPFLTEADVDVVYRTPAALDAALADMPESFLTQVEADTFFCAGRVLSFLQDNFMSGQPGILRNVRRLESLVRKVDPAVMEFLEAYGLTVMDGCFQWLHCLLARELPLSLVLRLWDCYLAIGVGGDRPVPLGGLSGASTSAASDEAIMYFHVCVCCSLLRALRTSLMGPAAAMPAVSSGATVGGWAAALVTALPGFRTRALPNGAGGVGGPTGPSTRPTPSIDVVMTTLKRPFEALFPNYPSLAVRQQRADVQRQRQPQQQPQHGSAPQEVSSRQPSPPEDTSEEMAAERWLDLLIADAYCIWRLHPLNS